MRRPLASGLGLKAKANASLSRPISVKGVSDKDAGAKNYKKCRYNFKHGQPLQKILGFKRNALVESRLPLHSQNDSTATQRFCCY